MVLEQINAQDIFDCLSCCNNFLVKVPSTSNLHRNRGVFELLRVVLVVLELFQVASWSWLGVPFVKLGVLIQAGLNCQRWEVEKVEKCGV